MHASLKHLIERSVGALVVAAAISLSFAAAAGADPAPVPSASPSPKPTSAGIVNLGDIFVTAQRHDTGQAGTTRQTFRLSSLDMERMGAVTVGDALAMLPGIAINDYGTYGHLQTALVRGAGSTETLVLVNGRPANEPGVGLFDFSSLPVEAVDRVEVVEGAASTLWGSAAMGGVINIITKDPGVGSHGSATAGLGYGGASWSGIDVSAGTDRDTGIRVSLSDRHALDEFSYPASYASSAGTLANNDANVRDAFVTVARLIGSVHAALHIGDDASDNGEPGSLQFGAQSMLARQQRYFVRSDLALDLPSTNGDLAVDLYSDGQRIHYYDGTSDPANFIVPYDTLAHIATRGFGIRDTLEHGSGTLTVGFDGKGDRAQFDEEFGGVPSASPATDATTGWYASDEERSAGGLTETAAVREERPQGFASTTVPSLGIMWRKPDSLFGLRANYGRAFRTPALEETSPLFFGNPKLEPEYAATFDVGAFDGDSSLTYFGSRASNLIVSTPPLFIPENVSAANIRGIAATFAVPLDFSDRLDFNYTDYLRADDLTNGARLPYRPTATGSVRWSRSASRGFAFGATLDYVGRRFADDPNTVLAAQYASVGAFLSHAFGARTKVTVRVNDLTGERVEDVPGYPVLGSTVSASVSTSW